MPGSKGYNGAAVAWHPVYKKYYCAFAGNSSYPMGVFTATGRIISDEDLEGTFDVRGLWFNPDRKKLEGNAYSDGGWIQLKLDEDGMPFDHTVIAEGQRQPDVQSVGSYDVSRKMVFFLEKGQIRYYDAMGDPYSRFDLKLGVDGVLASEDESVLGNYNNVACYTGFPGAEFALLNTDKLTIELYNRQGLLTRVLALPDNASVSERFSFSYANGSFWLFDKELRTWVSYK